MWSYFFFKRIRIRSTDRAEDERRKFKEDYHFITVLEREGLPGRFRELEQIVRSDDFKRRCRQLRRFSWKRKANKPKWRKCEEYLVLKEYKVLKRNSSLRRYNRLATDPVFNRYSGWRLIFEDNFETFDCSKWLTRYFAGERFLQDTYGVGKDTQLFMPDNVCVEKGFLCLKFCRQQVHGKYWDSRLGIIAREYNYTSGMVNTALSFRQYLGRFEVKLKIVTGTSLDYCFWLAGDRLYPHINIVKFGPRGYEAGYFSGEQAELLKGVELRKRVRLKSGFYIFTLDWLEDRMIWKINDCVVKTMKIQFFDSIPLYACLSLGTTEELMGRRLPERMQVEWVRFYAMNNAN